MTTCASDHAGGVTESGVDQLSKVADDMIILHETASKSNANKTQKAPLSVSINTAIHNKEQRGSWAGAWRNVTLSPDQLMRHVSSGYAWSARNHGRHGKAGFQCTNALALDVDHGADPEQVARDPFVRANASFVHTTASHTAAAPRFRVVFQTDALITDPDTYRRAMEGLNAILGGIGDPRTFDAGRMWYGAENCEVWPMPAGNLLSLSTLLDHAANPAVRPQKPAHEAQRHEPARHTDNPGNGADSPLGQLWAAIEAHYGVTFHGDNSAEHVRCIHPEHHSNGDSKPSAKLNRARRVLYCYACRRDYLAIEIAQAVGIELPEISARGQGLSNAARETLLQAKATADYARVFDAAIRAGLAGKWTPQSEAKSAMQRLGIGLNKTAAAAQWLMDAVEEQKRKALSPASAVDAVMVCAENEACSQGNERGFEFLTDLTHILLAQSNLVMGQNREKIKSDVFVLAAFVRKMADPPATPAKRGRPSKPLYFPTHEEIDALLAVPTEHRATCDTLPDDAFSSAAAYRTALHRALHERTKTEWSNAQHMARLGVSRSTLKRMDRRAGLKKTLTYRIDTLREITPAQLEYVKLGTIADSLGCEPGAVLLVDGHTNKPYPVTPNGAQAAQAANRKAGRDPVAYLAVRGPQRREARPRPAVSVTEALEATEKAVEARTPAQTDPPAQSGVEWLDKWAERGKPAADNGAAARLPTPQRGGVPWPGEYVAGPCF